MKLGIEGHFLNKKSSQEDMLKVKTFHQELQCGRSETANLGSHIFLLFIINGGNILGPLKSLLVNFAALGFSA